MGDDMGDSLLDIRAKYASKITTQLINISKSKVPQQKSVEFLKKLKCLYFEASSQPDTDKEPGNSAQPILKFETIDAFTQRRYVALSYTWKPSYEEISVPSGGYLVEDICSGKPSPSSVRNTVFSRMRRYMNYENAKYLWIDKHCIQQEDGKAKEIGMQAMDRVYSLSCCPVTLLSRTIKTSEQLELLIEILSQDFVVHEYGQYWISRTTTLERAHRALDLLNYITSDPWFSRGWTFQESYPAGSKMTLLITHVASIRAQKPSHYLGALDGELCINSWNFYEQATKLCLAYQSHQPRPYYWERIISRAGMYKVLLQSDDSDEDSAEGDDSAPVSMSPTIINDIANRKLDREWDRLAIIANCCQYINRLDSTKLQGKHSLDLSLLALCLINGEIFSNHPKNSWDNIWTRRLPIADFLHTHFFHGLRSSGKTGRLTFNKGCRFSNVILRQEGVQTEGYLWRLDGEISTTSFHRHGSRGRRYQRRLRPLEWLARRLAAQYRILSQRIYNILNLSEPLTPPQRWQLSMACKIEEAISQGKMLCTATAAFLGRGPLPVAIFVIEPEDDDDDSSSDAAESLIFDQASHVFTSIHRNQQGQQSFEKAVFLDEHCRRVFGLQDPAIVKRKEIRNVIRDKAISIAGFPESKLVGILHYLIANGIFRAEASIQREFPDLYDPGLVSIYQQEAAGDTSADQRPSDIIYSYVWLESLFKTGNYSDLILASREKNYPAHRAVVCPQSSVIEKKCQFQDATQGPSCERCGTAPEYRFDFLDDDPQSVDCLVQFLYRQDYQDTHISHEDDQEEEDSVAKDSEDIELSDDYIDNCYPVVHVRMYALAEKYDISALKDLALGKFNKAIQQEPPLDRFLDSAEEAYTSTVPEDRGMRDAVVKHFHTHPELLDDERTYETLHRTHSLMYDLLMYLHKERTETRRTIIS
ncbi:Heterokaryon incompatibility [Fusarium oxysporum f. sp. vasinfectum]|nr:Heterokaryon incompatibility [Fusarium oxysporum f. sp. vasinfectum]